MDSGDLDSKRGGDDSTKKSCWQRYDAWVWSSGPLKRSSKAHNSIKGSAWSCHVRCLAIFRICVALFFIGVWLEDSIADIKKYHFFALQYFTIWGVWLTTTYFIFASISHLRYWNAQANGEGIKDSTSPWHCWKWLSTLFMTAFLWECVIASVYWSLLYPLDRDGL